MRQRQHNSWFQFKQFRIEQGQSAMKITTHACLFGALVPVAGARQVLDIGTGTGLLSLMLAQRSRAEIDAVELDAGACHDAAQNFARSPWSERLHLHPLPVQQFQPPDQRRYDCIVSNPPFFSASWRASDRARNLARHDDALPLLTLLSLAAHWLQDAGLIWLLLPVEADDRLLEAAAHTGLALRQQIDIRSTADKPIARRIVALGRHVMERQTEGLHKRGRPDTVLHRRELCIHGDYPAYSHDCLALLRPYYSSL